MMSHIETLTRYVANFVDELVKSGLTDVVISPGSRSTPLAMTMCEHEGIKEWVMIDERSAAFFALGMAKETGRAVALVCTSGTAAANYYPAIIEAHYGRVPLIVLTADRPHELRDVGAPQAIEQIKMYGDYVKWFQEMALPEASTRMLSYIRGKAMRAVHVAQEGNKGPVHLNFPFREPLVPDFTVDDLWGRPSETSYHTALNGNKRLSTDHLLALKEQIIRGKNGLIVCGPQIDKTLAKSIAKLASTLGVPVLADPLSQLRSGKHDKSHMIEGYDAIFRNQMIREQLKPSYIIRFGAMPVSKSYLFYVEEHEEVPKYVVENYEGFRDPTGDPMTFIYAEPNSLCEDLSNFLEEVTIDEQWLEKWQHLNDIAKKHLLQESPKKISEGETVRSLMEEVPSESILYVGNSMAVRDLDTFFLTTDHPISVLANRGANGIDGVVSSALGAAAVASQPLTLLIGDLSFYHDLNGLLAAKQYEINMTIVLINNNGGGIFSFLPQATDEKYFESLFGTPLHIDFEPIIRTYGGTYRMAENVEALKRELAISYEVGGLFVIEVKTDRNENLTWHREKWQMIEQELIENV